MDDISKLTAKKKAPLAELLADLRAKNEADQARIAAGLTDLGMELRGKPAFVRLITLEQADRINYACMDKQGNYDATQIPAMKPRLIAYAVVDSSGAPIFKSAADVDVGAELGLALWTVCARINRIGVFRGIDAETGEADTGN